MNAQQQLAELMRQLPKKNHGISYADLYGCLYFIRDHGPAIAELIRAALAARAELSEPSIGEPYSRVELYSHDPLFGALAELTEPK